MLDSGPDPIKSGTPLRPEDIAAMCEGKEAFASAHIAHKASKRRKGVPREVYHCRCCNHWHVGTPMPKRHRQERQMLKRPRNRNGVRNAAAWGKQQ